ncbi:hypothetical protein C8R44DRAFT_903910 [Mycena epipterygia]|nr:hypothetical protein C8R44DRAFT_903910 [Mycena epipterygia]
MGISRSPGANSRCVPGLRDPRMISNVPGPLTPYHEEQIGFRLSESVELRLTSPLWSGTICAHIAVVTKTHDEDEAFPKVSTFMLEAEWRSEDGESEAAIVNQRVKVLCKPRVGEKKKSENAVTWCLSAYRPAPSCSTSVMSVGVRLSSTFLLVEFSAWWVLGAIQFTPPYRPVCTVQLHKNLNERCKFYWRQSGLYADKVEPKAQREDEWELVGWGLESNTSDATRGESTGRQLRRHHAAITLKLRVVQPGAWRRIDIEFKRRSAKLSAHRNDGSEKLQELGPDLRPTAGHPDTKEICRVGGPHSSRREKTGAVRRSRGMARGSTPRVNAGYETDSPAEVINHPNDFIDRKGIEDCGRWETDWVAHEGLSENGGIQRGPFACNAGPVDAEEPARMRPLDKNAVPSTFKDQVKRPPSISIEKC